MVLLAATDTTLSYLPFVVGAACGLIVLAVWRYRKFTAEPATDEFEDLQFSLGAEPAEPDIIGLKNMEIAALTERLVSLESLGHRIAHIEKRHIAERERLETELLEASLQAEEKKSYERRWKAIRTRYRNLKERLDEIPEGLDEAEGELVGIRKDLDRSDKRSESLQKEVERLKQRLTRRDAMLEKTKDRLERVLVDNEKQRDKAAQLRQEQVESKREVRELRQQFEGPRAVDLMREPRPEKAQEAAPKKRSSRRKKSGSAKSESDSQG
jgi:chromosome segregation ATPase